MAQSSWRATGHTWISESAALVSFADSIPRFIPEVFGDVQLHMLTGWFQLRYYGRQIYRAILSRRYGYDTNTAKISWFSNKNQIKNYYLISQEEARRITMTKPRKLVKIILAVSAIVFSGLTFAAKSSAPNNTLPPTKKSVGTLPDVAKPFSESDPVGKPKPVGINPQDREKKQLMIIKDVKN